MSQLVDTCLEDNLDINKSWIRQLPKSNGTILLRLGTLNVPVVVSVKRHKNEKRSMIRLEDATPRLWISEPYWYQVLIITSMSIYYNKYIECMTWWHSGWVKERKETLGIKSFSSIDQQWCSAVWTMLLNPGNVISPEYVIILELL